MISARREPLRTESAACSVATALAASSARMFNAACAPIASDTVPASAAAILIDRREIRSCRSFITVFPWSLLQGRADCIAPKPSSFFGVIRQGVVVELRAICGTATNNPLTCLNTSSNREECLPNKALEQLTNFNFHRRFLPPLDPLPPANTVSKSLSPTVTFITFIISAAWYSVPLHLQVLGEAGARRSEECVAPSRGKSLMSFFDIAGAACRALTAAKHGPSLYDICDPVLLNNPDGDAHLSKFYRTALANPALRPLLRRAGLSELRV